MRVLMIARPRASKGTQAALIAAHFETHIATGDLLRDHVARAARKFQVASVNRADKKLRLAGSEPSDSRVRPESARPH